ncbi:energy transducer TonB [Pseudoduganella aquatica]|nr:energy transducer TonB [Pseudoduganella aquatica]
MDAPQALGLAKLGKFSAIVAIHAGLFYLLQTGMLRDAVHAVLPQVVTVSFVTPPPPPPAPPAKTVPVLQQAPAITPPPLPLLNITVDNTITLPPAQPRSNDKASEPASAQPQQAAPAPPAPPSAPRLVQGVEYVRPPAPVYPTISRRLGESGVVMLRVLISEKGLPEQATIQKSSGSGNLDEAGRSAAMRTLFKPYMEDGKPVAVYVLVPINFQLS